MTRFFCHQCLEHYEADPDGTFIACPKGHSGGQWSRVISKKATCKICGASIDRSYRIRLDEKNPKGGDITRPESREAFAHFAQFHPHVLREAAKELGFELKTKRT